MESTYFTLNSETGFLNIDSKGCIVGFASKGSNYTSIGVAGPSVIKLLYSDASSMWEASSWHELNPDKLEITKGPEGLEIAFNSFQGVKVSGRIIISVVKGEFCFNTSLKNESSGVAVGIASPIISGLKDTENGCLYCPDRPGQRVKEPFKKFADRPLHMVYPVPLSMQYITYNDSNEGWALYCRDKEMKYKNIHLGGSEGELRVDQFCFLEEGQECELPSVCLMLYKGTWHTAADNYREWFETWGRKPRKPESFMKLPVISGFVVKARPVEDEVLHDVTKNQEAGTYENAIRKVKVFLKEGSEGAEMVGWADRGHDTDYPEFKVSEAMGGREGLKKLTAYMKSNGMLVGFYLNARLGNINSEIYTQNRDWVVIHADNEIYRTEKYGGEKFDVMCPYAKGFANQLKNRIEELAGEYNADFVQLDQIGAALSYLCFNRDHGHSKPETAWPEGYAKLICFLEAAGRSKNPDFWVWTEGCWEGAAQYVSLSQGGFWPLRPEAEEFSEMFRYTLPWFPLFGDALMGGIPMWVGSRTKPEVACMKEYAAFFNNSRFMDSFGLNCDCENVAVKWHKSDTDAAISVKNKNPESVKAHINVCLKGLSEADMSSWKSFSGCTSSFEIKEYVVEMVMSLPANSFEFVYVEGSGLG